MRRCRTSSGSSRSIPIAVSRASRHRSTGRLIARGLDGRSYPFRVDRNETDHIDVRLSRLHGLRLGLYVDGRMLIDDGTRRSRVFRIRRWPMLDREMRRVVDLESEKESFGGGRPSRDDDHWRE